MSPPKCRVGTAQDLTRQFNLEGLCCVWDKSGPCGVSVAAGLREDHATEGKSTAVSKRTDVRIQRGKVVDPGKLEVTRLVAVVS